MSTRLCALLLCCLFFIADGCDSKRSSNQTSSPNGTPQSAVASASGTPSVATEAKPESGPNSGAKMESVLDACRLIEKSEIESVQVAKVQGAAPSKRGDAALDISQCYYTAFSSDGSKDLSVHLEVMQNDPNGSKQDAVGDLWRVFQGVKGTKKMEKPRPIAGVGDAAYWVGNNKSGALYVLKKDKLIRVSLGGPDDEVMKIEKSKTLIEKALKRLS